MLYACIQRFDVTGILKNLAKFWGTKLAPSGLVIGAPKPYFSGSPHSILFTTELN